MRRHRASAAQSERRLKPLIGLRLSIARRAADLRVFHFGAVSAVDGGTVGQFALHNGRGRPYLLPAGLGFGHELVDGLVEGRAAEVVVTEAARRVEDVERRPAADGELVD